MLNIGRYQALDQGGVEEGGRDGCVQEASRSCSEDEERGASHRASLEWLRSHLNTD